MLGCSSKHHSKAFPWKWGWESFPALKIDWRHVKRFWRKTVSVFGNLGMRPNNYPSISIRRDLKKQRNLLPDDLRGGERSQFGRDSVRFLSCLHLHHRFVSGLQADKWTVWNWGNVTACLSRIEGVNGEDWSCCDIHQTLSSDSFWKIEEVDETQEENMKEGRKEIWKFKWVIFPNAREEFQRKTLTKDSDSDFLLFGIFPTRHPACVEASVRTLELRDGQNIVEQHVRSMFQEPLGSEACIVDLKVERRKSHKINTEGTPLCR